MAEELEIPGRQTLEDTLRRLLNRARRRTGASATAMVELLGPLQARSAGTRRSWYDWHERPETVSALAALGALHLLGPSTAVEVVFGQTEAGAPRTPAAQAADLERQLVGVREELAHQRELNAAVQARLEELTSRLEAAAPPARVDQPVQDLKPLAAAIIVRNDRVLLTERRFPGHGEQWSWPSGKVERGESLEEAILRELVEELLISDAKVIRYVGDIDLPSGFRMSHFHVAIPADAEPKLNDYEQLIRTAWMTRDEAQQALASLPPDVARQALELLDRVLAELQVEAMDRASAEPVTKEETRRAARRRARGA